jgi:ATP-dependent Lon protease
MNMEPAQTTAQNTTAAAGNQIEKLAQKLGQVKLPADVLEKLKEDLQRVQLLSKNNQYSPDVDKEINYINFVCDLPWGKVGQDILDLKRAKAVLDKNHHGLEPIKERILEYLSVLILNHKRGTVAHQPILAFLGLVGSGKTTLAFSIAEALGRPIARMPFGGLGSALQLRGESRVKAEAEPGLIMRSLMKVQVKNPVILLDELDRVTTEARNDIMGVLVELLDPEQNSAFLDHYVSFPFDLSQVLFVATANNTANIATAVMDRLEVIEMPFYSDEQKVVIAKSYLLPEALKNAGVDPRVVQIDPNLWPNIVRPLGFDGGIRSLKRNVDTLVRKIAKKVVEGNAGPYQITQANIRDYIAQG